MNKYRGTYRRMNYRGFTLVELMMVIAIIALLLLMLAPSFPRAMEATRRVSCGNRLRNIYEGATQFSMEHKHKLPVITDGFGIDATISSYKDPDDSKPEAVQFAEDFLGAHADWVAKGAVRMDDDDHVYSCPSAKETHGDPKNYSTFEFTGVALYVGEDEPPLRPYLQDTMSSRNVQSSKYRDVAIPGPVNMVMDRTYAEGAMHESNHYEGCNVVNGDGTVKWVFTDEFVPADSKGDVLTRIMAPGANAPHTSLSDVLRPKRSYGWHGRGTNETSFYIPLGGKTNNPSDRWKRHQGTSTGNRKKADAEGIFF